MRHLPKLLALALASTLFAQSPSPKGTAMHAAGTFDVKLAPQSLPNSGNDNSAAIARFAGDKQFHGDLDATSHVEMLASGNPASGNAGYVALESVTGKLNGRSGSFVLQHSGTMDHGALHLTVTVVPGSATGELTGLSGSMSITNNAGKHSYTFDYSLPEAPVK
jgi:hypothetical protein